MAARAADTVQLAAKPRYLRGRSQEQIDELQRAGMRSVGVEPFEELPDEPSGLRALLVRAADGDVLAMMIHQARDECVEILEAAGATPDDAATIRRKAPRPRAPDPRAGAVRESGTLRPHMAEERHPVADRCQHVSRAALGRVAPRTQGTSRDPDAGVGDSRADRYSWIADFPNDSSSV